MNMKVPAVRCHDFFCFCLNKSLSNSEYDKAWGCYDPSDVCPLKFLLS